jgi:hypothetical protein
MKRQGVTESPAGRWTRPEDYLGAMARKRSFRRNRRRAQRSQPESPRLLLSTVPFAAMITLLAVLGIAIMVTAFPLSQPHEEAVQVAQREQGVAARGWFQEAQREFHR